MASGNNMFWLISVPAADGAFEALERKVARESDLASVYRFRIPDLKVGTLNALMLLSDELGKADSYMEQISKKMARQHHDLVSGRAGDHQLTAVLGGNAVPLHAYMTRFEWDEPKYPVKNSIKELADALKKSVSRVEEDMKTRFTDFNSVRSALNQLERKSKGNLTVRSLGDYLSKNEMFTIDTEHLITIIVVVQSSQKEEFLKKYETVLFPAGHENNYVVPHSALLLAEDEETAAYTVCVFKKIADDFRRACRENKWTVRDWERETAPEEGGATKASLQQDIKMKQDMLIRWCSVHFAECFMAWIHLKAIRAFVESVLRYGLPPRFMSAVLLPKQKNTKKLRSALDTMYKDLGGDLGDMDDDGGDALGMGLGDDFYSYVYLEVDTAM